MNTCITALRLADGILRCRRDGETDHRPARQRPHHFAGPRKVVCARWNDRTSSQR
jgi:hypothetical protein